MKIFEKLPSECWSSLSISVLLHFLTCDDGNVRLLLLSNIDTPSISVSLLIADVDTTTDVNSVVRINTTYAEVLFFALVKLDLPDKRLEILFLSFFLFF